MEPLYEFENATVPESEAWNKVRNRNPWTLRVLPQTKRDEGSPSVFERIYPEK